jgi:hypothetical protein
LQNQTDSLIEWLKKGNASTDNLERRPRCNGLFAAKSIQSGDDVVFIPRSRIITPDKALGTPIGAEMAKNSAFQNDENKSLFLTVFILQEMFKPKDIFGRYFDIIETVGY